jgi:hypothetical protein
MRDTSVVLRKIEQYEDTLHVACLAPRTGRVVPLRCDAFTGLYDSLAEHPCFDGISRRLVQSHWTAHSIIERMAAAATPVGELGELARVRDDIHGQLRALRRGLARRSDRAAGPWPEWIQAILFRKLP